MESDQFFAEYTSMCVNCGTWVLSIQNSLYEVDGAQVTGVDVCSLDSAMTMHTIVPVKSHVCSYSAKKKFSQFKEKVRSYGTDVTIISQGRWTLERETIARPLNVDCPMCKAKKGNPCTSLHNDHRGGQPIKWAHELRLFAGLRAQGYEHDYNFRMGGHVIYRKRAILNASDEVRR